MEVINLNPEDLSCLHSSQAWHYRVLPQLLGKGIRCHTDGMERAAQLREELEMLTGRGVELKQMESTALDAALQRYYPREQVRQKSAMPQYEGGSEDFLATLIQDARGLKSSDIHMEIYEGLARVRIRIDGQMIERYQLARERYPAMVNKIKILAGLDIAEKRLPQDGRIHFQEPGAKLDLRVSVLPTLHGEKVVLRLLSNDAANIDLGALGFSDDDLQHYLNGVQRPNGLVLISGPTGSGKTTTLYATLKRLNKETRNILTIEDPIEYTLEGINQVQLKEGIGLTFGAAMRTFLRQDPDVIMVGEIRDVDTASMAIRAALTGHLVLSTIHTNSAWGTISRLIDMGVPAFLLAGTLNTTVAQRLLRMLCPQCKEKHALPRDCYPRQFRPFRQLDVHYMAKGCPACFHTGYRGRKAVYEIIPIDKELSDLIKQHSTDAQEELRKRHIPSLAENAFALFAEGSTSLEEIYPLLFNF